MHRPHGLQGSLKRRYKHPSLLPSMGTTRQKSSCRNGLQNGPRLLSRVKAGTHSPSPTGSHTAAYTPKQGPSGQGRYHYPRRIPHVHEHPRAGCQNGKLCRFWVLAGGALPKNAESLGTAMRSCVSLFRGVAAPLGCVIFFAFVEIGICTSGAHGFPRVRGMGGITTLGVLFVLLKRRTAACQNSSFAVF